MEIYKEDFYRLLDSIGEETDMKVEI